MFIQHFSLLVKLGEFSFWELLYFNNVAYLGMIKPQETLEKSSKLFMFDPNLGEGLQEKLLSESICSQPSSDNTDFLLKETSDQELFEL